MTDNAEQKVPAPDQAGAAARGGDPKAEDPKDDLVTTHHVITTGGAELRYTVTAGRVVLRTEGHTDDKFDGAEAKAEVFVVAYTLDDADASTRPVTFAFNGGPGSSSVWVHLGLLGPRRVLMATPATCCRRPTTSPITTRPCSGTPTWFSSTRYRPGTPARSRARSPRTSTDTAGGAGPAAAGS